MKREKLKNEKEGKRESTIGALITHKTIKDLNEIMQ